MKKLLLLLFISNAAFSQQGWKKVNSTNSVLNTNSHPGIYKGVAWVDVDADGDQDLFSSPNTLFVNQGALGFELKDHVLPYTPEPQQPGGNYVSGCSWADVNNDGLPDVLIAQRPSAIFINQGNYSFVKLSIAALDTFFAWGGAFGNIGNDKLLDYMVVHAANFHGRPPYPSQLALQSSAAGAFNLYEGIAATDTTAPYTVPYFFDFDLDNDQDLFIASGPGGTPGYDFCYRNLRTETGIDSLAPIQDALFAQELQDGQCYNFIDYDNDADLDLCLTNYNGNNSRLYRNDGGTYTKVITPFTGTVKGNLSNVWADFDNDADLDVLITADNSSNRYYRNDGSDVFTLISSALFSGNSVSGAAAADYDNDGDLDLFFSGPQTAIALFRNDTVAGDRSFVNISLKGNSSNTSALGAKLILWATINGKVVRQYRELTAQNSFQGHSELRQHFGLGRDGIIDSLVIEWPVSGKQVIQQLQANVFYAIEEGNAPISLGMKTASKNTTLKIFPNPSQDYIQIQLASDEQTYDTVHIYDQQGKVVWKAHQHKGRIHVAHLPKGVYSIIAASKERQWTGSFIKK